MVDDYLNSLDLSQLQPAWDTLTSLTILDPTGGSGAFLLAALELLTDCYTAVYERAESELHRLTEESKAPTTPAFVDEATTYASPRYFILKSAMLKNLYSLDIMREAGEIARLRMYLKLAAQVKKADELEPLPDLEFNIRTGNLLVGIADDADFKKRFSGALFTDQQRSALEDTLQRVRDAEEEWQALELQARNPKTDPVQYQRDRTELAKAREELRLVQAEANDILDRINWAARESREVPEGTTGAVKEWVGTHQPFHWLCQFPHVFTEGGFDVIIGNPPYIRSSKVKQHYKWTGFATNSAPDIYAICLERSIGLLAPSGRISMIVPHSMNFSTRQQAIRNVCEDYLFPVWTSMYDNRPCELFRGVRVKSSILAAFKHESRSRELMLPFATHCQRWVPESRSSLFGLTEYSNLASGALNEQWFRSATPRLWRAIQTVMNCLQNRTLERYLEKVTTPFRLAYRKVGYNYVQAFVEDLPKFESGHQVDNDPHVGEAFFSTAWMRDLTWLLLSGTWGFCWWTITGDSFHYTRRTLRSMPADLEALHTSDIYPELQSLVKTLQEVCNRHVAFMTMTGVDVGRYDMSHPEIRSLLYQSDALVAQAWGLEPELEVLRHAEARHLAPIVLDAPIVPDDGR